MMNRGVAAGCWMPRTSCGIFVLNITIYIEFDVATPCHVHVCDPCHLNESIVNCCSQLSLSFTQPHGTQSCPMQQIVPQCQSVLVACIRAGPPQQ